eukprot:Gb_21486 [translate_table: standard]
MLGGLSLLLLVFNANREKGKLPPGPPAWPVVGNLFQIGNMANESLFHLAQKYGPIITLHLGVKTTIVVSSPAMAKEVLKTNDQFLAGRTVIEAAKCASYSESSLIYEDHLNGKSVNIGHTVLLTTVNLLGNMIFSQNMFGRDYDAGEEFKEAVGQLMVLGGVPNLADFFPWLRFLDPQGNHTYASGGGGGQKDLLDVLFECRSDVGGDDVKFTEKEMTRFLYDMFVAGSETTSTTIEWAMAELIHNPHTFKRVQAELEEVVGRERKVEESDTERLPYLHAVVKEVFRLHPAAPLLIQHRAESSCEIAGFDIPKGADVVLNVWAIGRDPTIWKEPRICPGLPLANRMVHFVLASLLHSFDWTLPHDQRPEKIDMTPKFGITLRKDLPFNAIPSPRSPASFC